MTKLYEQFLASIATADRNALIIFGIAAAIVAAWHAIKLLPHAWQYYMRLIAWCYAIAALVTTIIVSM